MSYLNNEQELLAKYAAFASQQALVLAQQLADNNQGKTLANQLSGYKTYREAVVDPTNSESNQLGALSMMVTYGQLDQIPIPPTFNAFNPSFIPTPSYTGVHNDLLGLQGGVLGEYFHLTQAQVTKLNNLPTSFGFSNISGSPFDNTLLGNALNAKQPLISAGTTNQFYAWDKTYKSVSFAGLSGKPTTLSGYGISASDTLFDSRYLRLVSPLTGLGSGSNTPITASNSVLQAFANLQAQISAGTGITDLTGDVTATGPGSSAATIGANKVTNAMLAQVGTATFKGRVTSGTGNVQDLTATQATSILNVFTSGLKGLAPASGGGTTNFLRADGTWATPTGSGTVTSIAAAGPTGLLTWSAAVISSGTLTATLVDQAAGTVFAGPTSGANATPAFRALVASDIPTINQSQVNGLVTALTNKLSTTLTDGKFLLGNAANAAVGVAMAGDATLSNTGALTIANAAITFAKMQNITYQTLMGRWSAGDGAPQEISIGSGLNLDAFGVLTATGGGGSGITSLNGLTASTQTFGTIGTTGMAPAWTSATSTHTLNIPLASATSVTAGLISKTDYDTFNAKQAALSGTGYSKWSGTSVSYLTPTQVTADLNAFTSLLQGLAPASGGGTTNFLRADGTWAVPSGGGGGGGVTTVGTFSASAQTNGADITGTTITFGPASATVPGMVSLLAQTWTGVKTFAATNTVFTTTNATNDGIIIQPLASGSTSLRLTITTASLGASRVHTIPDGGANANFVLTQGAQTIVGATTFSAITPFTNATTAYTMVNSSNVLIGVSMRFQHVTLGSGLFAYTTAFVGSTSMVEAYRIATYNSSGNDDTRISFGLTSATAKFHVKDNAISATIPIPMMILDGSQRNGLIPANTETRFSFFNAAYNYNFATGTVAAQRTHYFTAASSYIGNAGTATFTNAATVAISGAPGTGGLNSVFTNTPSALWVESGQSRFDGNVLINSALTMADAINIVLNTTTGTKIGTATTQKLGFFNATPVVQQTMGSATAGVAYGATEQAMLQKAYDVLRTIGLGS